jgi:glycine/D-amino acid oxidase-like deaminating enzyme/nitrite reductase/ring-hydroxylating ferredoxin subunit
VEPAFRSIWHRRRATASHAALAQHLEVDCAVVGAGITGLTLAALLTSEGLRVAVLERARVASGATGASSAHLTFALDTDYRTLRRRFGDEALRSVLDSLRAAFDAIETFAEKGDRDRSFRRVPGFRFCEERAQVEELREEGACARELGIAVAEEERCPLPFPCAAALRFEWQAEIDPVAHCQRLAQAVLAGGGLIFESSPVVEVSDDRAVTCAGWRVSARHVVEATHTPLGLSPLLQTRLGALTSYCIAARLSLPFEPGLYWDCGDPYHYLRALDDGRAVIAGGEDHRTGRERQPGNRLRSLLEWLRARLPVESTLACWSHEFFEPADGLPYIGLLPGASSHYVATGYSGTGLTFGTVAALLIRDLVVHGASPWQAVYAPSRLKPLASGRSFVRDNLAVAWHLLCGRLRGAEPKSLVSLPAGRGCITKINGSEIAAAYRDPAGELHLFSPRCTHLGCTVAWNDLDKTWDCPCHGGRFRATGEPLYGPPLTALAPAQRPEVERNE